MEPFYFESTDNHSSFQYYTTDITSMITHSENYFTGTTLVTSHCETGDTYTVPTCIKVSHNVQQSMVIDV